MPSGTVPTSAHRTASPRNTGPSTQERTMRGSGKLYGAIARHRALRREDVQAYAPSALRDVFG